MENHTPQVKRAKNMIWAAAGDYSFDPNFIGLKPDGTADPYLNMIHGLVRKWFDFSAIDALFSSFSGKNQELYESLLWLSLEHCVYEKERQERPVLEEMRLEYALENLKRQKNLPPAEMQDLLYSGYFREIAGQPCGLPAALAEMLHAFLLDGSLSTPDFSLRIQELLSRYFSYRPGSVSKQDRPSLLHNRRALYAANRMTSGFIRITGARSATEDTGFLGKLKKRGNALFCLSSPAMDEDTFAYIESCFGRNMYNEKETALLDQEFCTGNHKNLHLFFTRGEKRPPSGTDKTVAEIRHYCQKTAEQQKKNLDYYQSDLALHQASIARLRMKIQNAMDALEPVPDPKARAGTLHAGRLWRNLYLNDPYIFTKRTDEPSSSFSIDLMLDASSSRDGWQEKIAAQGYILAESLSQCGIPVQIYSFVTIRDYTVLKLFKTYTETDKNKNIFEFVAGGNNRDGLALKGASHLLKTSPMPRQILIVLTDANPYDDFRTQESFFLRNQEYAGESALLDTAAQVRCLRQQGVCVLGVFMGLDRSVKAAAQIFGKDFVKIKEIGQFADAVGALLQTFLAPDNYFI